VLRSAPLSVTHITAFGIAPVISCSPADLLIFVGTFATTISFGAIQAGIPSTEDPDTRRRELALRLVTALCFAFRRRTLMAVSAE
jgi:hypothetical protein